MRAGTRASRFFLVAAAIAATATLALHASTSKFFQAATQADFLKGDVTSLSIDSQGRLTLGPATELVYETSAPFLWALIPASDGSLFVGTGNEGKVFRVDPQGKGMLFFDAPELEVHALAAAPNGGLYVATSPDGRIYKVDRDGKESVFFDPDDKYIWSLALDSNGNLFAGTGEKGLIYKITPEGRGSKFYETKATHVTSLTFEQSGDLLVGTGTPGRVLRVDTSGKGFVLLDSPYDEIRSIRLGPRGLVYVAALNGRPSTGGSTSGGSEIVTATPSSDANRPLTPSVSVEVTSFAVVDTGAVTQSASATSPRDTRRGVRGGVYRISPDGLWDQLWESRDDAPYDLAFTPDGAVMVGTGNKGKIYRLSGEPIQATLVARGAAQQITAFYKDARGRTYYATANPGKLFRLTEERATRGTYESEPRDAQLVSSWGSLSWRGVSGGNNQIEVSTRSGNTETPDETWSAWSPPYKSADGSAIVSPKARYLQWRAVLSGSGEGPSLTSITAAYLQRNIRPQVRSITVHPPGIVFQKPFGTGEPELAGFEDQTTPDRKLASAAMSGQSSGSPALGRRTYQKGLETLIWKADDENDDELVYDVLYRREDETAWKVLRRAMKESILVWDTTTVPNGTYFVRVVASDSPSNPAGTALAGELDSVALEIDNTPPAIIVQGVRFANNRTTITFDVKDDHSAISRVEFSTDGQQWRGIFPTDGVADSRSEHYEIVVDGELGDLGLAVRASDVMNNVANGHVDRPARR